MVPAGVMSSDETGAIRFDLICLIWMFDFVMVANGGYNIGTKPFSQSLDEVSGFKIKRTIFIEGIYTGLPKGFIADGEIIQIYNFI